MKQKLTEAEKEKRQMIAKFHETVLETCDVLRKSGEVDLASTLAFRAGTVIGLVYKKAER